MYNHSIVDFTNDLASSSPAPGGGGASALVGAVASALAGMVGSLTIGKKKYAQYNDELIELKNKADELSKVLLEGINDDAKAFEPLAKAYGIPKDDPSREEVLEACLKVAADAPLSIMKNLCEAITVLKRFGEIGSKLAISDAATGAMLAHGALYGAAINVKVNTKLMKDKEYAEGLNKEVDELLEKYSKIALETYKTVEGEMH